MKMSEMFPGKWLKKEDVPAPVTATISRVTREEVNADNGGKEMKVVLAFAEPNLKPMILNVGNAVALTELYGDDSDHWLGKRVEVYTDPNVMFGGKRIGGLRLRAPSQRQQQHTPSAANGLWDYSDGHNVTNGQTTEQVRDFLAEMQDGGAPLSGVRVKPAGAPREAAKTGDVWLRENAEPLPANSDGFPF